MGGMTFTKTGGVSAGTRASAVLFTLVLTLLAATPPLTGTRLSRECGPLAIHHAHRASPHCFSFKRGQKATGMPNFPT
jgi:hypothetical protein